MAGALFDKGGRGSDWSVPSVHGVARATPRIPGRRVPSERLLTAVAFLAMAAIVVFASGGFPGTLVNDGPGVQLWIQLALDRWRETGQLGWWYDEMWTGTPAWSLAPLASIGWLVPLAAHLGAEDALKYTMLAAQILGGWGTYVLARAWWGGRAAPFAAGVGYSLFPMIIGHVAVYGHEPVALVFAAIPWFAWTFWNCLRDGRRRWTVASGLLAAVPVLQQAEHAYALGVLAAVYLVAEVGHRWRDGWTSIRPVLLRVATAAGIAVGLSAHWLVPLLAAHDQFVLTPGDAARRELTTGTGATIGVLPDLLTSNATGRSPSNIILLNWSSLYIGLGYLAVGVITLLVLSRKDKDGALTATLVAGVVSLWTIIAGVPLARGNVINHGALPFIVIAVAAGLLMGAVVRRITMKRRRILAVVASLGVLVAAPYFTPFLLLRDIVPLLDTQRFPRLYIIAPLAIVLAFAFPVTLASRLPWPARPRSVAAAAAAVAVLGIAALDVGPQVRMYDIPPPYPGLDALSDYLRDDPRDGRVATAYWGDPEMAQILQLSGRESVSGWPHPMASKDLWTLVGDTSSASPELFRRAVSLGGARFVVGHPATAPADDEFVVARTPVWVNPNPLPLARAASVVVGLEDHQVAAVLAIELAHRGIAVVTGSAAGLGVPGIDLGGGTCAEIANRADTGAVGAIEGLAGDVARACQYVTWFGYPWLGTSRFASHSAERRQTVGFSHSPLVSGARGMAVELDRPPGPMVMSVHEELDDELGPELGRATTSGADADGLWVFDFGRPFLDEGHSYRFTMSCAECGRNGGPRLRVVSPVRGAADVYTDAFPNPARAVAAPVFRAPSTEVPRAPITVPAVVDHGNGLWRADLDLDRGQLLVVASAWFPGWRATVDGEPVDAVEADGAFVGVPVPAGQHTVEIKWHTSSAVPVGAAVSLLTVVGLLLWAARTLSPHAGRRKSRRARPEPAAGR